VPENWLPSKNVWDEKQADLKNLRNLAPDEVTEMLGKWGEHPFYGAFFLSSEITSSEIMWSGTTVPTIISTDREGLLSERGSLSRPRGKEAL
jgi:hypothetical protein